MSNKGERPFAKLVEDAEVNTPCKYVMSVDTYDEDNLAYCLIKWCGHNAEVLLAKVIHDKDEFNQEVSNLSNYFDAECVGN